MVQIDGIEVARWAEKAREDDLRLLMGTEYSDTDSEWTINDADTVGILISKKNQPEPVLRPYSFFSQGTFFVKEEISAQLSQLIEASMTTGDRIIDAAKNHLRGLGFAVSQLGGDSATLLISNTIKNFQEHKVVPNDDQWGQIHEIFSTRSTEMMTLSTQFIAKWIEQSEKENKGRFDIYRRVLLAYLYRHTSKLDKALEVSAIVELPRNRLLGTDASISVLCTTRAAALMDCAEKKLPGAMDLLRTARLTLNKANAMSASNSDEIRNAYKRLKKLESEITQ
jgi:hypothetical protein